jgi:hypothetical protein
VSKVVDNSERVSVADGADTDVLLADAVPAGRISVGPVTVDEEAVTVIS